MDVTEAAGAHRGLLRRRGRRAAAADRRGSRRARQPVGPGGGLARIAAGRPWRWTGGRGAARGIDRASKVLMSQFFLLPARFSSPGAVGGSPGRRPGQPRQCPPSSSCRARLQRACALPAGPAPFLDRLDLLAANILLPLGGIAIALTVGWQWRGEDSLRATGLAPGLGATLWLWSLRLGLPLAIGLAVARGPGLL
jgi:hypothetical protein